MSWIDIRVRKPKESDGNKKGRVFQLLKEGSEGIYMWYDLTGVVAWMPIPKFEKIDPPEGYRLVDTTTEPFRKDALWLDTLWKEWKLTRSTMYGVDVIYCVPIDPPKPAYRPFKDGKEFEPFENEWTIHIESKTKYPPMSYSEVGWGGFTWEDAFNRFTFADGRPFGMPSDISQED